MKKTGIILTSLFVLAVLATLPAAAAEKENVTFKNMTASTQYVLVVYGGDGQCSDMPEREQIMLAPGESATVESGDSNACWCSSTFGKIGDCRDHWVQTKAGKVQKIR